MAACYIAIEQQGIPDENNQQSFYDKEASPTIGLLAAEVETTGKPFHCTQAGNTVLERLVSQRWFGVAAGFPGAV